MTLDVMLGHLYLEYSALSSHLKKEMLKLYEKHLKRFGETEEDIFQALELWNLAKVERPDWLCYPLLASKKEFLLFTKLQHG